MFTPTRIIAATTAFVAAGYIHACRHSTSTITPTIHPTGDEKKWDTRILEMGARMFQRHEPIKNHNIYLVGFHPIACNPSHQMEAHHYCKQVNEDFAQCLLFDGNTKDANLTGLEYIISENLYNTLPQPERQYWHPHNYEILSGQLIGPGLPNAAEHRTLQKKMNSYGKTYHTWRAKCWEGDSPFMDRLPLGPALLAWSFNHDDEIKPDMIVSRDKAMGIYMDEKRKARASLATEAHSQNGTEIIREAIKRMREMEQKQAAHQAQGK